MLKSRALAIAVAGLAVVGILAAAPGPISALPGWSQPDQGGGNATGVPITVDQREQIRALHEAYQAAVSELDWRADENGHRPETIQQARNLKRALHAGILDVIHRGGPVSKAPDATGCPYSGRRIPARLDSNGPTLHL